MGWNKHQPIHQQPQSQHPPAPTVAPTPNIENKVNYKSVEEPIVNGKQGPYSDDYVKQQKAVEQSKAQEQQKKAQAEKSKQEHLENMKNPIYFSKYMLKMSGESLSKSIKEMKTSTANKNDLAKARVEAAKAVVSQYKKNKTEYGQENREFGLDAKYADCSSTVTTMLRNAGQGHLFKAQDSKGMRAEITALPTNNVIRKDNPAPGDIMLWGGHVAIVTEIKGGKVFFAMMGSHGAQIGNAKLDKNDSLLTESTYGHGGFIGFWTPNK